MGNSSSSSSSSGSSSAPVRRNFNTRPLQPNEKTWDKNGKSFVMVTDGRGSAISVYEVKKE